MIPLEKQVVSLELAKRLKELGVKQESLFFWMSIKDDDGKDCWAVKYGPLETFYGIPVDENISAFTVAELGEMLPYCIEKNGETFYFGTGKGKKLVPLQG
jgi:hypothetical protein